ncbi:MAG: hypothetical protein ACXW1Q_08440 [Halobacteriota archaeon]
MVEEKVSAVSGLSDSMSVNATTGVTANRLKRVKLAISLLRFIEVLAVVLTCLILVKQTQLLVQQTQVLVKQGEESRLSNKMQVASYLREHYQTINKVLAEHSEARDAFGLDIKKVMAYMLLAEYDNIFQMFEDGMIDDRKWQILEPFIRNQMNDDKLPIRTLWSNLADRGARSPGFEDYVEVCVYSGLHALPAMNKASDGMERLGTLRGRLTNKPQINLQKTLCPE